MIPGVVHAALVTIFTWLVTLLFNTIGVDLGGEIATQLATIIVAYILSLVGLGAFNRVTIKSFVTTTPEYRPPFT